MIRKGTLYFIIRIPVIIKKYFSKKVLTNGALYDIILHIGCDEE
jgi:hypothetical protein